MIILDIHSKAALSRSGLYQITCDIQDETGMIIKNTTQIVTEQQLKEYFSSSKDKK